MMLLFESIIIIILRVCFDIIGQEVVDTCQIPNMEFLFETLKSFLFYDFFF